MKTTLTGVCLVLSLLLCLTSCTGYNGIMYDHLSDKSNYRTCTATVNDLYYQYKDNEYSSKYDSDRIMNASGVLLYVTFDSKGEIAPFIGVSADSLPWECEEYIITLEIIADNCKVLAQNGFFDVVEKGTEITLTTSDLIYMDANFFYISAITYEGVEYLKESTGLQNIKRMMNQNRSAF